MTLTITINDADEGILMAYFATRNVIVVSDQDAAQRIIDDTLGQFKENSWRSGVTPHGEEITES